MKKLGFLVFCLALFTCLCFAQDNQDGKEYYHTVLDNGLEVFVVENSNTPLVRIELCFRAGSSFQDEKTEGIFHLYEHMLFKGNSLYENSAEIKNAMNDLGVSDENGTTATDYVNYFFTVPARSFEKGMEFWASAVISPKFDEAELENEKKVVISEINGTKHSKNLVIHKKYNSVMFPGKEKTFSPSGDEKQVSVCTVETLKKMKNDFYCPNNCAIFISGNVTNQDAVKAAEKYFGSWEKSDLKSFGESIAENSRPSKPLDKNHYFYAKSPKFSSFMAVFFAGPDTSNSIEDTYSADLLSAYLSNSSSSLAKSVYSMKYSSDIKCVENFSSGYLTTRINGLYEFYFDLESSNPNLADTVQDSLKILTKEFSKMEGKNYFSQQLFNKCRTIVEDSRIISFENPENLIQSLRYYWAVADASYAESYYTKMQEVSIQDLENFARKYLAGKNYIVVLYLNSQAYENQMEKLKKMGFEEIQ